jgi:glycoprotein 3-alpha-L-fucosyltransferase
VFPKVKFSLAFENTEETDYVTEKFFQSIDYGAIPVVIGAPNIQVRNPAFPPTRALDLFFALCILNVDFKDFAPSPNSYLHLKSMADMPAVVGRLKYLMKNDTAYDEMHAYKVHGPTDSFLALVDLGIIHPECRLCILLADRQRQRERQNRPKDRPCACRQNSTGASPASITSPKLVLL